MATFYSPKIITSNLAVYLDAANIKSYPGNGSTVYDLTGNAYNGSLVSGATYSSSAGGSFYLDGTSTAYIILGASTRYMPMTAFTLETWVKSSGLGSGMTLGGLISVTYGITFHISTDGNLAFYNYNTDNGYPGNYDVAAGTSGVNMFDGIWHHVAAVRGASTYQIYVDGVTKVNGSVAYPSWSGTNIWSSMNAELGNNPNDAYYKLKGFLSLSKIYKRALTANEIRFNYDITKGRFGL